jgi:SAM-dependent methyltransferase
MKLAARLTLGLSQRSRDFKAQLDTKVVLNKALRSAARSLDTLMLRRLGAPYLLLTRDWMIHERMRYLTDWAMRLPGPLRVLDAGCGAGLSLSYLERRCASKIGYYAGIDLDTHRARLRHRGARIPHDFIDADLDSPWLLGKFDLIFASEVIEHLVDDRRLFGTLCDHLAEDGVLVVTTPNKVFVQQMGRILPGFDSVSPTQDGGHVRIGYDHDDLLNLAEGHSVVPVSLSYLAEISIAETAKRNLLRNHADFSNTTRFNPSWVMRRTLGRQLTDISEDQCWSVALAFRRFSIGSTNDASPYLSSSIGANTCSETMQSRESTR